MKKLKPITDPKVFAALNQPMQDNDAGALTIREYFFQLLNTLWEEGEGFSGKRPFGNSCWEHEIYQALVVGKHIKGALDEDGYLEDYDRDAANKLVTKMIQAIFQKEVQ
jgi:hypothetical protein